MPLERRAASESVERKVIEMRAFQGIKGLGFAVSEPFHVTIFVCVFVGISEASNRGISEHRRHVLTPYLYYFFWSKKESGLYLSHRQIGIKACKELFV